MNRFNFFQWFFSPSEKDDDRSAFYLADKILELQKRVEELERENETLKELISETESTLREQIDKIHPVIYNITESNKGT